MRGLISEYGLGERLKWGLQVGTPYLVTREVVESGAMSRNYRNWVLNEDRTLVTGESIGLRARQVASPYVYQVLADEEAACAEGLSLPDRRIRFEKANLGNLARAVASREGDDGCFMAGESVALLQSIQTIEQLHTELLDLADDSDTREPGASRLLQSHAETSPLDAIDTVDTGTARGGGAAEPIAIIGMGCVFPGCPDPRRLFENLLARRHFIRPMPEERLDSGLFYREDRNQPLATYSRIGAWLDAVEFDAMQFRVPPRAAAVMDLGQKLALICARQALLDAGLLDSERFDRERTAVIIGNSMGGGASVENLRTVHVYEVTQRLKRFADETGIGGLMQRLLERLNREIPTREITEDSLPGELSSLIAGRVAAVFDLHGPNFTVDAACGSGLAAVAASVQALRQRTIDLALAGGVDTQMDPASFIKFSKVTALSGRGSFPFDHRADGFVMGEGAGIVLLKRLSDAQRDGDRIYAVILGIGQSSDGKGRGITAPNPEGQRRAISRAWADAGVPFSRIGYLEAHGTGTRVGDEMELTSAAGLLETTSREGQPVLLGSIKANLGHTKAAAGIAGLIKTAWVMQQRLVPPQPNFERFPESWNCRNLPFVVCREPALIPDKELFAGVSSFGFGGTNHHVVLGEAPNTSRRADSFVIPTSFAPDQPEITASSSERTALMFPGQGSQYVGMFSAWMSEPSFRDVLERAAKVFAHQNPHQNSLLSFISPDNLSQMTAEQIELAEGRLRNTIIAQPAILAVSCGLLEVLRQRGVRADMTFGHSLGEYAALYAAGSLTLEQILDAVCVRAQYMGSLPRNDLGAMGVVGAPADEVATELTAARAVPGYVTIANRNSPKQTVISGETAVVETLLKRFADRGVLARRLPVSAAFHSDLVGGVAPLFRQRLETFPWKMPTMPVPANLTGEWYPLPEERLSDDVSRTRMIDLLTRQVSGTVDFIDQVERAWKAGVRTFIEVGPKNVLCRLVDEILGARAHRCLHTDHPRQNGHELVERVLAVSRDALRPAAVTPSRSLANAQAVDATDIASVPPGGSIEQTVRKAVEEISGYPASMIRPELDLEADLGIDTLKIFEIASRLRKVFPALAGRRFDLSKIRTLQSIVELIRSSGPIEQPALPTNETPQVAVAHDPVDTSRAGTNTGAPDHGGVARHVLGTGVCGTWQGIAALNVPTWCSRKTVLVRASGNDAFDEALEARLRELDAWPILYAPDPSVQEALEQGSVPEIYRTAEVIFFPIAHERFGRRQRKSFYREQILHLLLLCRVLGKTLQGLVILTDLGGNLKTALIHESGAGFLSGVLPALCKGLVKDFPQLCTRTIDLPSFTPEWVEAACRLGCTRGLPAMVGIDRDGRLTSQTVQAAPLLLHDAEAADQLRELLPRGSVVLATGGAAGITAHLLKRLARELAPRLIILGRSPDRSAFVQELRQTGAEVWYLSCDLADGPAVDRTAEVIRRVYPRIDLLLHGAGLDISRHLSNKTPEEIDRVYRVKVAGLVNLIDALGEENIGAVTSFSSVSSFFGNHGQVDYAAANGFLNAFIGRGRSRYLCLAWSAWDRIGMVSRGPIYDILQANGVTFITPEAGEHFFLTELADFLQGTAKQRTVGFFGEVGPGMSESGWLAPTIETRTNRLQISPDATGILWDHVIGGRCVIPGVVSLYQLVQAVLSLQPEDWLVCEEVAYDFPIRRGHGETVRCLVQSEGEKQSLLVEDSNARGETLRRRHLQALVRTETVTSSRRQEWLDRFERLELLLNETERGLVQGLKKQVVARSDLYSIFFHGPSFQVLADVYRWSDRVLEAHPIPVPGLEDWRSLCGGRLWPFVLETAFHAAGLMCLMKVGAPEYFLPHAIGRVSIVASAGQNLAGMRVLVEHLGTELEQRDALSLTVLRFQAVVVDGGRRPVAVLEDLRMVAGRDRPADLRTFLATGFPFSVHETPLMILVTDDARRVASDQAALSHWLHPEEQRIYAELLIDQRKADWLAGRMAAKILISDLIQRTLGMEVAPASFAVISAGAFPQVKYLSVSAHALFQTWQVSISHTQGRAIAALAKGPLGVDIEQRRAITPEASERAFTARERHDISPVDLITVWTAKEAVMKAT
ncbi:MAG TPA: SDR family NAD(P)-dependent oxidoreductase, partial [Candidatus Ozemobacteraceae bacterium]|nr:SDR family NAD(P)-dependent oxidoreductase [Candidatus Ozemobacteraceae bacterium]